MSARRRPGALLLCLLLWACSGSPAPSTDGRFFVVPDEIPVASLTSLSFRYLAGTRGLDPGAALRWSIPVDWAWTRSQWTPPQVQSADEPGFVSYRGMAREKGAEAPELVPPAGPRVGVEAGKNGVVLARFPDGLPSGATVFFDYDGEVSKLYLEGRLYTQLRPGRGEKWTWIDGPALRLRPEAAAAVALSAPADVGVGESFSVRVAVLDTYGNRPDGYRGTVRLSSSASCSGLTDVSFSPADRGVRVLEGVRVMEAGFCRISGVCVDDPQRMVRGQWVEVHPSPPALRRYFGDVHFHTGTGAGLGRFAAGEKDPRGDHRGQLTRQEDAYAYARDVAGLDFAGASEHNTESLARQWAECLEITEEFNVPGVFSTFFAYEWKNQELFRDYKGQIDRVILSPDPELVPVLTTRRDADTDPELHETLRSEGIDVLVIPHVTHPWPRHYVWIEDAPDLVRLGEIFSNKNAGLLARFEEGPDDRWSFQYIWKRGRRVGVIGSSDSHLGHPGIDNIVPGMEHTGGLAVVWAERNDRSVLFEAMKNRATYSTSGPRILVDFRVEDARAGGAISSLPPGRPPRVTGRIASPLPLRRVRLIRFQDGEFEGLTPVDTEPESPEIFCFELTDEACTGTGFYYLRAEAVANGAGDEEGIITSPIWIGPSTSREQ